jgi:hypothetical protein
MRRSNLSALGLLFTLSSMGCTDEPDELDVGQPPDDSAQLGTLEQGLSCQSGGGGPLVPAMTSNTSPSGIVTRSGVYSSSYEGWKAFDFTTTTATLWLSNMYTSSVWLGYEWGGGAAQAVTSYQITYANGSCCHQRAPKNWTLQGWNGWTWVVVDTVSDQTGWYGYPVRTYTVDSPGSYTRYRLHVTADNYNHPSYPITLVSIGTLQLYGSGSTPQVPIMSSSTTPSGYVSRSSVYGSSYEAWQVFDGTTPTATLWLSDLYVSPAWIGYEWGGGTGKVITSYAITYANGSCCEQRGPRDWTLQGWNGSAWVAVDTVAYQSGWYSSPHRTFDVDSPGCYSAYRLHVTADNYNDPGNPITMVSIASLQLHGY